MAATHDPIDSIRHDAPCSVPWTTMVGDDRVRHCMSCDLNVYNFAEMTRDEIREVVAQSNGRFCARLHRRADGTLVTRSRTRLPRALTAALLSIAALASACASKAGFVRPQSKVTVEIEDAAASQQAALTGVVRYAEGTALPGVTVQLRNESNGATFTVITDVNGAFNISGRDDGIYRLEVSLAGFTSAVREHLLLQKSKVARARVVLPLDGATEMITVGAAAIDPITESGVTTTFTQDFVNKMPL